MAIKLSQEQYKTLSNIINQAVDLLNSIEVTEDAPVLPESPPPPPAELSSEDRQNLLVQIRTAMYANGWTQQQARDYSQRIYGKRTVNDLSDSELAEIARYLSQHTPDHKKVVTPCN